MEKWKTTLIKELITLFSHTFWVESKDRKESLCSAFAWDCSS